MEEDSCMNGGGFMHEWRRIHAWVEEDSCMNGG